MAYHSFLRIAALLTLFLIPGTLHSEPDESMPDKIPDSILADWADQGGTAAEIQASVRPQAYIIREVQVLSGYTLSGP